MMASPSVTVAMVRILADVMHSIPEEVYEDAYKLNSEIGSKLYKYNATTDLDKQAADYLYTLRSNVFDDGHHSLESVSEFMGLMEKMTDPKIKHALLRIAAYDFGNGADGRPVSEFGAKLLVNLAVGPYSTIDDKISCIRSVYDPKVMESALTLMRKDLQSAFNGKYPDINKINFVRSKAADLLDACEDQFHFYYADDYAKAGYHTKIKEEFLDEKAIYAKYDRHNDRLGQPEYMIQDVIPGTEKDIKYDDGHPEQQEPQKQPESPQVSIIEVQQQQQIEDLNKQIQDMQKQIYDLRKENSDLRKEKDD